MISYSFIFKKSHKNINRIIKQLVYLGILKEVVGGERR